MSKCKADVLSYQETVEHMIAWVDGDKSKDEFSVLTSNIEVSMLSETGDSGGESSVEDQESVKEEPQRLGKTVIKNRLDSSLLDMRNYNLIVYLNSEGNFETFKGYFGPKSNKSMKIIIWDSETPAIGGRSCDVINNHPGTLRGKALRIETIQDAFSYFFHDKMFKLLLTKTNEKIS